VSGRLSGAGQTRKPCFISQRSAVVPGACCAAQNGWFSVARDGLGCPVVRSAGFAGDSVSSNEAPVMARAALSGCVR
jgi:hypothetical protein